MEGRDWLADHFEENHGHLRGVAHRMLSSLSETDDAVHEAWLRLSRADTSDVRNLRDVVNVPVADRPRHPLAVAIRVQTDSRSSLHSLCLH